jgi:dihydroxyacetone kinase-like protein
VKKLINDPARVVDESVEGFGLVHADLVAIHTDPIFVSRAGGAKPGKVGLVSGGGSGHEPLHAGFVGLGMLDAAVPGAVFTSPTPDAIHPATVAANGGAGVLHIVKNYTGDVLNFETAAELADAEDIEVKAIVVNDDVAVEDSLYTAGRRGVAGTVAVEKIAGAAAERGDDLAAVLAVAEKVNANVRTMGVALSACTVPHAGKPSFDLTDAEIEIGIGIHGEPGRHRIPMAPADEITEMLTKPVLDDLGLGSGEQVLLFVNGMGGTPASELYIVYRAARKLVEARGAVVSRSLVGNYVTSLEMQGASVTVLRLDDELTALWDAPVHTPALRW